MNRKHSDYVGTKIEMLEILEFKKENKKGFFYCKCECGNEKWMRSDGILNAGHKSCGCVNSNHKHGMTDTRLFNIWNGMKTRCNNRNDKSYKDYGGRGIGICLKWLDKNNGFINFYQWAMDNGYQEHLTLDRIDVNGNYEPKNCRWATHIQQSNNLRNNFLIEINGETKTASEWARETDLSRIQLVNRYNNGVRGETLLQAGHKATKQSGVEGVKWDKSKERWKS